MATQMKYVEETICCRSEFVYCVGFVVKDYGTGTAIKRVAFSELDC